MQKLFIISNESIYENNSKYFCDNLDLKSTPEGLNNTFEVNIIARKSSKERSHSINIENISIYRSILTFILAVIKSTKNKDCKYLLISISPYTFVASLFLKLFGKNKSENESENAVEASLTHQTHQNGGGNKIFDLAVTNVPDKQERAHKDRIKVNIHSPEALEEPLWNYFFPFSHDRNTSNIVDAGKKGHEFDQFYKNFIKKVICFFLLF